jgi:alkanesulfonate monooxygenase SsuD/methylene tetrahydromethanopterin reductase-like flavin-dependent oxidoreductase (luciferase family)
MDMRLGYFSMPVHPPHRIWSETLAEDREAVLLADRLGFHDAFIGEHLTDRYENITSSMIFLASVAAETRQIRLATGTANLSQQHPVLVAAHAAMLDHLTRGRFILGVSPGALPSDAEALGILDEDRNAMFAEAIDVILQIWSRDPPYDIELPNNRFRVTTRRTISPDLGFGYFARPYQQPRPEIVGTVLAPFSKGVIAMGRADFHPLSAHFLLPQWLKSHWDHYAEGKRQVGLTADRSDWRVARAIFVADDARTARRYGSEDQHSPYRFYFNHLLRKLRAVKRHEVFKAHPGQPDEEITVDSVMDSVLIKGTVDEVVEQLASLHDQLDGFGEVVYAGLDWVDPALARRSMELMAGEVMPALQRRLKA